MVINRVRELLAGHRPGGAWPIPQHAPAAQVRVSAVVRPGRPGAGVHAGGQRRPAAGDALEDYFDRLDAAFANIGTSPSSAAPRLEPDDVSVGLGNLSHAQADRTSSLADPMASWDARSGRGIRFRRSGGRISLPARSASCSWPTPSRRCWPPKRDTHRAR